MSLSLHLFHQAVVLFEDKILFIYSSIVNSLIKSTEGLGQRLCLYCEFLHNKMQLELHHIKTSWNLVLECIYSRYLGYIL